MMYLELIYEALEAHLPGGRTNDREYSRTNYRLLVGSHCRVDVEHNST